MWETAVTPGLEENQKISRWEKRGENPHPVNKIQNEKAKKPATWKPQAWLAGKTFS